MEPMIARAFLWLMLTPNRREQLEAYEKQIQPRYLQGFEICAWYGIKPNPIADEQMAEMLKQARTFGGILKGRRMQELKADRPEMTPEELDAGTDGKIDQDDMGEWCRFVETHYRAPAVMRELAVAGRFA